MTFNRAVFWSGIWNIGLGLTLIIPPITEFLGVQFPIRLAIWPRFWFPWTSTYCYAADSAVTLNPGSALGLVTRLALAIQQQKRAAIYEIIDGSITARKFVGDRPVAPFL